MTGRIPFGLTLLLTVLANLPIQAQNPMGPPMGAMGSPPGYYGAPPAGMPVFQDAGGMAQFQSLPNGMQQGPMPAQWGTPPRTVFEELPDNPFGDEDTPLGRILTETIRRSWFRGEYILWRASGPGNQLLGQQPLNGIPQVQILGNAPNVPVSQGLLFTRTVNGVTGQSEAPTLDGLDVNSMSGFRGTFGIPLPMGQVEVSGFVLAKNTATFSAADFINPGQAANAASTVGGTTGANGLPAQNLIVPQFITQPVFVRDAPVAYSATSAGIDYDVSYRAVLSTSIWGTEANYVVDSPDPNSAFQLRPSFGFRYFDYRDRLDQFGQYNVPSTTVPNTNNVVGRSIISSSNNNLWGPQLGLRAEFTQWRFIMGVEPKIMLAANSWQSTLATSNVFGTTDRSQNLAVNGTGFSPLFDAKFYGSVALSKNVSWYVSYNFIYAGNLNHSYNDIIYNQNAAGQSDFHIQKTFKDSTIQGMSFGFDVRF